MSSDNSQGHFLLHGSGTVRDGIYIPCSSDCKVVCVVHWPSIVPSVYIVAYAQYTYSRYEVMHGWTTQTIAAQSWEAGGFSAAVLKQRQLACCPPPMQPNMSPVIMSICTPIALIRHLFTAKKQYDVLIWSRSLIHPIGRSQRCLSIRGGLIQKCARAGV